MSYNLGQKVLIICTFLPTERLFRGFVTAMAHPLAPPWSGCLVGIRNDRTGLKHCFFGGRGVFVVVSTFNS